MLACTPRAPMYISFLTLLCMWQHGQTHCMQARRAPLAKRLLEPQMVFPPPPLFFLAQHAAHKPQTAATSPFWGGGLIFFFVGLLVLLAPSRSFLLASLAVLVADRALLMPLKQAWFVCFTSFTFVLALLAGALRMLYFACSTFFFFNSPPPFY
jgi:hypothetical protein